MNKLKLMSKLKLMNKLKLVKKYQKLLIPKCFDKVVTKHTCLHNLKNISAKYFSNYFDIVCSKNVLFYQTNK